VEDFRLGKEKESGCCTTEVAYFLKFYFHITFHDPALSRNSVIPSSKVCITTLVLLMTED
jgi:hypothetical protein